MPHCHTHRCWEKKNHTHHQIRREALSVRERMSNVLAMLKADSFTEFAALFNVEEGRRGVVVTFMAVLELLKEHLIDLVQAEPFAPIYVKTASASHVDPDIDDVVTTEVE